MSRGHYNRKKQLKDIWDTIYMRFKKGRHELGTILPVEDKMIWDVLSWQLQGVRPTVQELEVIKTWLQELFITHFI